MSTFSHIEQEFSATDPTFRLTCSIIKRSPQAEFIYAFYPEGRPPHLSAFRPLAADVDPPIGVHTASRLLHDYIAKVSQ